MVPDLERHKHTDTDRHEVGQTEEARGQSSFLIIKSFGDANDELNQTHLLVYTWLPGKAV